MTNLTTLIFCRNQQNLDKTIQSILPLNSEIIVGGFSKQNLKYNAKYKHFIEKNDYSKIKNQLIKEAKTDWLLFLEAGETIMKGHACILEKIKDIEVYQFNILQGAVILKQIRLWHKSKNLEFINPIYETIQYEQAKNLPVYVHSIAIEPDMEIVKQWCEKMPLAKEPIYYKACTFMLQQQWDQFLHAANEYLFHENTPKISLVMIKYYCAIVLCYVKKDYRKALEHLLICLAENPTMAEFWCLLGDIYYASNNFEKAYTFYENATILGTHRLSTDNWPYEIKKYKEYPNKMMQECVNILDKIKNYAYYQHK